MIILTPLKLIVLPLEFQSWLLISMIPTLPLEWFGCPSWFHPSFLFISPNSITWDWLLVGAGTRNQSAQRKCGEVLTQWEVVWELHLLPNLIFIIPRFIEISRTKFLLRWVECNIPNLNYCIFIFLKYLFWFIDYFI